MDPMMKFDEEAVLPKGFEAAGTAAGIKKSGAEDMALIYSREPAVVAGVFTMNKVNAASVKLCRERLGGKLVQAVIVNSGNANACTGEPGLEDAREMARFTAQSLGIDEDMVMVSSTGPIGVRLPMEKICNGIEQLANDLSPDGGEAAAAAIMTTDTRPKKRSIRLQVNGRQVTLTGIAKGAGMIEPNMATMLSYLMTDADVDALALQELLTDAVARSFNRISIDGDMSTNDTVLFLANGSAGNKPLDPNHPDWPVFEKAVRELCLHLAIDIVSDGEGAEKVITIKVFGAATFDDADRAARAVANSFLVKTSWTGDHPHWGRIMDVLGYCGIKVDEMKVDIFYDDLPAAVGGLAADTPTEQLRKVVAASIFTISINLHQGPSKATVYTCECSEEYVRINR